MTTRETLVRRYVGIIDGAEDKDSIEDLFTPDFLDHVSGLTGVGIIRTVMGWAAESFADVETEVHAVMSDDERVSVWVTVHATHVGSAFPFMAGRPATGRRVSWSAVHVFRVAGDRLAEHWAVRDDRTLLQQLDEG